MIVDYDKCIALPALRLAPMSHSNHRSYSSGIVVSVPRDYGVRQVLTTIHSSDLPTSDAQVSKNVRQDANPGFSEGQVCGRISGSGGSGLNERTGLQLAPSI